MESTVFDILPRLKPWNSKVTNVSRPLARDLRKLLLMDDAPPSFVFQADAFSLERIHTSFDIYYHICGGAANLRL